MWDRDFCRGYELYSDGIIEVFGRVGSLVGHVYRLSVLMCSFFDVADKSSDIATSEDQLLKS